MLKLSPKEALTIPEAMEQPNLTIYIDTLPCTGFYLENSVWGGS